MFYIYFLYFKTVKGFELQLVRFYHVHNARLRRLSTKIWYDFLNIRNNQDIPTTKRL